MEEHKEIGLLIKRINEAIERDLNGALKKHNLTIAQVRVIRYIRQREMDGATTSQKNIEDYFDISHPTTVGIVKRLEKKGLIRCEFDTNDKRVKNIYLTQIEDELNQDMYEFGQTMEKKITKTLSTDEVDKVFSILEKIYNNVKK